MIVGKFGAFVVLALCFITRHFFFRLFRIPSSRPSTNPVAQHTSAPVELGVLGASNIARFAVVLPSHKHTSAVRVQAIAARKADRARWFATLHGINESFGGYDSVIDHGELDAVYIGLPTPLHAQWARRALNAGKHVLLEKPGAANAKEAEALRQLAREKGLVLMEGYHWRHHPASKRVVREARSLGPESVAVTIRSPFGSEESDAQSLGGGRVKFGDTWCYAVSVVLEMMQAAPAAVKSVKFLPSFDKPRQMEAELVFPAGNNTNKPRTATISVSKSLSHIVKPAFSVKARGKEGEVEFVNFLFPFLFHRISFKQQGRDSLELTEYHDGASTFEYQLVEFADAVRLGKRLGKTQWDHDGTEMVLNARVMDMLRDAGQQ